MLAVIVIDCIRIRVRICSCSRTVGPCPGRITCNGAMKRVFWSSGLVDRPPDRLYTHAIPLSGCMDRRSRYKYPFCFVLLVHRILPNFMALRFHFAAPTRHFAVFFLTWNMLVKRHSDFLALGFFDWCWCHMHISTVICDSLCSRHHSSI